MNRQQIARCTLTLSLTLAGVVLADTKDNAPAVPMVFMKDTVASPGTVRASKLIGTEVYDPAGEDVGKIKDIVVNRTYDKVDYTVVERGMIGINRKLLAMPYRALTLGGPADDRVYVQAPLAVVQSAPGFDASKWPTEVSPDYYRSLDAYYNTHLSSALGEQKTAEEADRAQMASGVVEPASLFWSRRASELTGRLVLSPSGEKLGSIEDLAIDTKTGAVRYAVMVRAGGMPDAKYYAVPLSAFRIDGGEKKLILGVTPDELKATPSFDPKHWPAQADPRWTKPAAAGDSAK